MFYFTSDLHFCHNKPFIYEDRGFNSIEEHDAAIIKNWNSIVKDEDTVFILGDLMLCNNREGIKKINQLNGNISIILGNHDTSTRINVYKDELMKICSITYADIIRYKGYNFFLCHYPLETENFDDRGMKHTLINLHGHTHSKATFTNEYPYKYNVALDAHNMYPVSIDNIIEDIKKEVYINVSNIIKDDKG